MIKLNKKWQLFIQQEKNTQIKILSELWKNSCFPKTGNYLNKNLKDIQIQKRNDDYTIIYSIYNEKLQTTLEYSGKIPDEKQKIPFKNKKLESFYRNVSNGFIDSELLNMGPEPTNSIEPFSKYNWEIAPKNLDTSNKFIIFNNGGSNYIVIDNDIQSEANGILWSSNQYSPKHINPIKVLDDWILTGLSDY